MSPFLGPFCPPLSLSSGIEGQEDIYALVRMGAKVVW